MKWNLYLISIVILAIFMVICPAQDFSQPDAEYSNQRILMLKVINKTGFDKYLDIEIERENNLSFIVYYKLNETLLNDIEACKNPPTCQNDILVKYNLSLSVSELAHIINNLKTYPVEALTTNISIEKDTPGLSKKNDTIDISNKTKQSFKVKLNKNVAGEKIKIGFTSVTVEVVESTNDVGLYSSIALDANGGIHISHYDSTNYDLRYCNKTNGATEWSCIKLLDVDSNYLGYPNGRWLAIKKGLLATSSSYSDYIHMSFYNSSDLYYAEYQYFFPPPNTVPTLNDANISPTTAYTGTKLFGNITCTDPDAGDVLTGYCQAWNGTQKYGNILSATISSGVMRNICNITTTRKGETWKFEMWCGDGTVNTTSKNTSAITILNSAPSISDANISPTTAYTGTKLFCNLSGSDIDGDTLIGYAQAWNGTQKYGSVASGTLGNGLTNILNITTTKKGETWKCEMWVGDGTINSSSMNTSAITILDTAPTTPTLSLPENSTKTTDKTPFFNWTLSSDIDGDVITYGIEICSDVSCSSIIQSNYSLSPNNYTAQPLDDGKYYWRVKAITQDANSSYTEAWEIMIDTTPPTIKINLPEENSYYAATSIELNVTITDTISGLGKCWYSLNNLTTNITWANCTSITIIGGEGKNNLYVGANDTLGNTNTSYQINFTIDITKPIIHSEYISPTTILKNSGTTIYVNVTDANVNISSGIVQVRKPSNERENLSMLLETGEKFKAIFSNTSNIGNYYIEMFWFVDLAGNMQNKSSDLVLTVVESEVGGASPAIGGGGGLALPKVIVTMLNTSLRVEPERVDLFYIYPITQRRFEYLIRANTQIKSCEANIFTCEVINETYLVLKYDLEKRNDFYYLITETIRISDGHNFIYLPATLRVINLFTYYTINGYKSGFNNPLFVEYKDGTIIGLRFWWIFLIFASIIFIAAKKTKQTQKVIAYATK